MRKFRSEYFAFQKVLLIIAPLLIIKTKLIMKKVLLMAVVGAFISTSMVSCSKCGHCKYASPTAAGAKLCSKDGKSAYDTYKAVCDSTTGATWETD